MTPASDARARGRATPRPAADTAGIAGIAAIAAAAPPRVLAIDVGGSRVKIRMPDDPQLRRTDSGPALTAAQMVQKVRALAAGWDYDVVSIGYPGPVERERPAVEPHNLGHGWVGFDYDQAFGRPVKVVNDAAMQALGAYRGGKMLFLGLGTGLGAAMIVDGTLVPLELAHMPYRRASYEAYVGERSRLKRGNRRWRRHVDDVVRILTAGLLPHEVVLGGGNAKHLKTLLPHCRLGDNLDAFPGAFRLWGVQQWVAAQLAPAAADKTKES